MVLLFLLLYGMASPFPWLKSPFGVVGGERYAWLALVIALAVILRGRLEFPTSRRPFIYGVGFSLVALLSSRGDPDSVLRAMSFLGLYLGAHLVLLRGDSPQRLRTTIVAVFLSSLVICTVALAFGQRSPATGWLFGHRGENPNWIGTSAAQLLCVSLSLMWIEESPSRAKLLFVPALIVGGVALVLSHSRTAAVSALVALLFGSFVLRSRRPLVVFAFASALVLVLPSGLQFIEAFYLKGRAPGTSLANVIGQERLAMYDIGLLAVQAYPVFGIGLGKTYDPRWGILDGQPGGLAGHLGIAIATGIMGFVLYIAYLSSTYRSLLAARKHTRNTPYLNSVVVLLICCVINGVAEGYPVSVANSVTPLVALIGAASGSIANPASWEEDRAFPSQGRLSRLGYRRIHALRTRR